MRIRTIATAAVLLLGLASCAGEPEPTLTEAATAPTATTQKPEPSPTQPAENPVTRKYVEAAVSDDPEVQRKGLQYAAEDSVAHGYLTHLANVTEAAVDGGLGAGEPGEVEATDGGYKHCGYDDSEGCLTFTGLTLTRGKVSDVRVNGQAVSPLLTLGNGATVEDQGVTFEFLSAYRSIQSRALFVTVKVTTGSSEISINSYSASYRAPDGKQRTASDAGGPMELGADSNTVIYVAFPGAKPGGALTLDGCLGDMCDSTFEVKINVGR